MILSASYRTDIPAFYADWFAGRVQAGTVQYRNPFGGGLIDLSLAPATVDGVIFWTRNFRPMMRHLPLLAARQWPFVVQYTVTGYPRVLEPSVIPMAEAVAQIAALSSQFGPHAVVWRYDPILFSGATDAGWHKKTFSGLATALSGLVNEVTVSFLEPYRKTRRNLDRLSAADTGFDWRLPALDEKAALLRDLSGVAADAGMRLTLCTQPELMAQGDGTFQAARCIDVARLSAVAGRSLHAKTKGNRPGCLCAEARDIGAYDTCPHGCAYCYAVANRETAKARHGAQDRDAIRLGR